MFRTSSGNTGIDAYEYEAQQIHNAQRKLDERAVRLAQAIADELPADASGLLSIASDRYPNATHPMDRESITQMIMFHPRATEIASIIDMARTVYRPGHVFDHGNQIKFA